jgi:hypothetical protein
MSRVGVIKNTHGGLVGMKQQQTLSLPIPTLKETLSVPSLDKSLSLPGPWTHTTGDMSRSISIKGGSHAFRGSLMNGTVSWKQCDKEERRHQGHKLRGRKGLEYAIKTENFENQHKQILFYVVDHPSEDGCLELLFRRRSPAKGWDPQPYKYSIKMTWKKFREVMRSQVMSAMAFYVTGFPPHPLVNSIVLSRNPSQAGSRDGVVESENLRKQFGSMQSHMQKHPRLDAFKLFKSSCKSQPGTETVGGCHSCSMSKFQSGMNG